MDITKLKKEFDKINSDLKEHGFIIFKSIFVYKSIPIEYYINFNKRFQNSITLELSLNSNFKREYVFSNLNNIFDFIRNFNEKEFDKILYL